MSEKTAAERAQMPGGHNPVLERRTVESSNRNLLKHLKPGLSVLDVGCGTGAITRGIAQLVGPTGLVLGIDPGQHLIEQARAQADELPWLRFEQADIYTFQTDETFDLVTCARTLQWLSRPEDALRQMSRLVRPGGCVCILDYNHEKLTWQPAPPPSMRRFYDAFLQWRQDAGFDNAIADHLPELMERVGLTSVRVDDQSEYTQRSDSDYNHAIRLWTDVAELRGPQLVQAGYITELERLQAIIQYEEWIATVGQSMTVYIRGVEAERPV